MGAILDSNPAYTLKDLIGLTRLTTSVSLQHILTERSAYFRDTVHKEMEKLSDDLQAALKRVAALESALQASREEQRATALQVLYSLCIRTSTLRDPFTCYTQYFIAFVIVHNAAGGHA